MGVLRLGLALLVVYAHCRYPFGRVGVGAENAVQIFYMISGFYMTLVLRGKYAAADGAGVKTFYVNRALRLFPAYLLVAAITLLLCLFGRDWFGWAPQAAYYVQRWHEIGWLDMPKLIWLAVCQLCMVGMESFNFFTFSGSGDVLPTAGSSVDANQLWRVLLVPQAWSLSVELYFYAVAPFLVRRSMRLLLGVAVASFTLRVGLWLFMDLDSDPWSYRFFPSELMFFMLGAIACRAYAARRDASESEDVSGKRRWHLHLALAGLAAAAVLIGKAEQPMGPGHFIAPLVTGAVFLALPRLFEATKDMGVDRQLGELSYPIYISHMLVIWIVGHGGPDVGEKGFLLVALIVLLLGLALYRWVDLPVDRLRHRRLRSLLHRERATQATGAAG